MDAAAFYALIKTVHFFKVKNLTLCDMSLSPELLDSSINAAKESLVEVLEFLLSFCESGPSPLTGATRSRVRVCNCEASLCVSAA